MNIRRGILRQVNTGLWWGGFKAIVSSAGGYASWASLLLQVFNLYLLSTGWLNERNVSIPLWLFIVSVFLFAIVVMIFEWKVTLPSSYKFTNEQGYKHDNPIRKDIELLQSDVNEIKEILNDIKKGT